MAESKTLVDTPKRRGRPSKKAKQQPPAITSCVPNNGLTSAGAQLVELLDEEFNRLDKNADDWAAHVAVDNYIYGYICGVCAIGFSIGLASVIRGLLLLIPLPKNIVSVSGPILSFLFGVIMGWLAVRRTSKIAKKARIFEEGNKNIRLKAKKKEGENAIHNN